MSDVPNRESLLRDMQKLIRDIEKRQLELFQIWVKHQKYHDENEAKWGLVKVMSDNPVKTLVAALGAGAVLAKSGLLDGLLKLLEAFK